MACVIKSNTRIFITVLSPSRRTHLETSNKIVPQCKSQVTREVLHIFLQAARLDQGSQATPPQTTSSGVALPWSIQYPKAGIES